MEERSWIDIYNKINEKLTLARLIGEAGTKRSADYSVENTNFLEKIQPGHLTVEQMARSNNPLRRPTPTVGFNWLANRRRRLFEESSIMKQRTTRLLDRITARGPEAQRRDVRNRWLTADDETHVDIDR